MSAAFAWRHAIDRTFIRESLLIALPVSLQYLLLSSMGLIDVLMVGQIGASAVAAVGLGSKFFFIMLLLVSGIGNGTHILASQYWGARREDGVRRVTALSLAIGVLSMLGVSLIMMAMPVALISLGTDDARVVELGAGYLVYGAPMLVMTAVVVVFEAALRAMHQTRLALLLNIVALLLNVLFNWLLILPHGAWQGLGAAGAALASVLARAAQALLLVAWIYGRRHLLALGWTDLRAALARHEWRRYAPTALPVMANEMLWAMGIWAYFLIYGRMGTGPLAVMSIVSPLEGMAISAFLGFGFGCSVMLGNRLGAGQMQKAFDQSHFFVLLTPALALILAGLLWWQRLPILDVFGNLDAATRQAALGVFAAVIPALVMKVLTMVLMVGILRSGGDTRFCLKLDLGSQWLLGIPLTALAGLVWHWPLVAVYLCALSEEALKALLAWRRWRQRHWVRNLVSD